MNAREYAMARRLIAEETIGTILRDHQRAALKDDERQDAEFEESKALIRAIEERRKGS